MLLVRLLPAAHSGRSANYPKCHHASWKQKALRALVNWLTEPIDFPGKTYHLDPDFANGAKR
jgi:hypothetical protein